jgi:electron transfer flavoprotein alpha subunit
MRLKPEGIWILEEHDDEGTKNITLELLSEGQKLARRLNEQLCVCLLGSQVGGCIPTLTQYGAEKIYLVEHELLSECSLDAYAFVLGELIKEYDPYILMMGATPSGSELAPRIAARFKLPCITEAKNITGQEENLQITKSAYNDQVYITIDPLARRPLIVTMPPGETDIIEPNKPREVEVIKKNVEIPADIMRTKRKRIIKGDPRTIRLEEADIIVSLGRGAGNESLPILQELADALGASIGGSRGAVDDGIIKFERQIGISGKTVTPRLLIACGISGAREFTAGMENSNLVAAVNIDQKARIFDYANLCIKGDLRMIIPQVIDKIQIAKQKREKGQVLGLDTKS